MSHFQAVIRDNLNGFFVLLNYLTIEHFNLTPTLFLMDNNY